MIAGAKHWFWSFIGLSAESMRRRHLPNIMINWTYDFSPVKEAADALKRLGELERSGGSWSADLSQVVRNFEGSARVWCAQGTVRRGRTDQIAARALRIGTTTEIHKARYRSGPKRDRLGMREMHRRLAARA